MRRSVIVVGGGPAGLAVAASARRRGLHVTVLDRNDRIGASWADRYDRLRLHTPRIQSHLPGARIPRRYGRFVARDDLVHYLEEYAHAHGIQPVLGVEVVRIDPDPDGDGWQVVSVDGVRSAGRVVLASGYNNVPHVPDWPGVGRFTGTLQHAVNYRDPTPFVGQRVLVVGSGNTGAEIATDLAEGGAAAVFLSVRTPPHVIPRTILGLPATLLGIVNERLPPRLTDPVSRVLARLTIGDLRRHGMPVPTEGLVAHARRTDTIPIVDVGFVDHLKAGRVVPVPAVVGFDQDAVLLRGREPGSGSDPYGAPPPDGALPAAGLPPPDAAPPPDGALPAAGLPPPDAEPPPDDATVDRLEVDAVIAATGYRTGLEPLVGHLGVLDAHGRPTVTGTTTHPAAPGLYFVGLRNPLSGLLLAIRHEAKQVARVLAAR